MKQQYWFYVDPYVHIAVKRGTALFYNSYNGKILEYIDNPDILRLARRLQSAGNLRIIFMAESDLNQPVIQEFVAQIRGFFMGDLIDAGYSDGKPIQMPPVVKNQKDVTYLKADGDRSVGEDIMTYLSEVSLYINDECPQNCHLCPQAYRQFLCCTSRKNRGSELDTRLIKSLFREIEESGLVNVNILGGDICRYSKFKDLLTLIESIPTGNKFYLHYLNAARHKDELKDLGCGNLCFNIAIDFPINEEKLELVLNAFIYFSPPPNFMFILQRETDFKESEDLVTRFDIQNSFFIPLFNGQNMTLFEENVFINRKDIEEERPSARDIHVRGTVNPLHFGRLIVLPDCRVYANVNHSPLGILGKHSLKEILFREMKEGKSWRQIRKHVMPCKQCTFESLCPPISNYSTAIGKYNLCRIWKDQHYRRPW